MSSATRSTTSTRIMEQLHHQWAHAYRDWANDVSLADDTSILRAKFPGHSEKLYQDVSIFLSVCGLGQIDHAWDIRATTRSSEAFTKAHKAWKAHYNKKRFERIETLATQSTDSDGKKVLEDMSMFVADRVGDSLVGSPSSAEERHKAYIAEKKQLKEAGLHDARAEMILADLRRKMFLESETD